MSDQINGVFKAAGGIFDYLLTHTQFAAVVIATLAAIAVTQIVKMIVIRSSVPNGGRRLWYSITTVIGLAATLSLWPSVLGFWWGLIVGGVFAPVVYLIVTRAIYKAFPSAEGTMSATPRDE